MDPPLSRLDDVDGPASEARFLVVSLLCV